MCTVAIAPSYGRRALKCNTTLHSLQESTLGLEPRLLDSESSMVFPFHLTARAQPLLKNSMVAM